MPQIGIQKIVKPRN